MKLSVVIPVLNQVPLARACYQDMRDKCVTDVEFVIIDNESNPPLDKNDFLGATIVRNEKNNGVYPTFQQGFETSENEIVAFFHSDVVIHEQAWDLRVIHAFEEYPTLGLVGFIGSDEIDSAGGRGLGTASNFMGGSITDGVHTWHGSGAEVHGKRLTGFIRGAVVDGCSMILRRHAWNMIDHNKDIGPHHFYDKMISCQVIEAGWAVGILGVEFDHISGQTANQEQQYQDSMEAWCVGRGIPKSGSNWDETVYRYSEAKWLKEYRDEKHLIPIKV